MAIVYVQDITKYDRPAWNKMVIQKNLGPKCNPTLWKKYDAELVESALLEAVENSDNEHHKNYPTYFNNGRLKLANGSPIRAAILKKLSDSNGGIKTKKNGKIDKRTKAYREQQKALNSQNSLDIPLNSKGEYDKRTKAYKEALAAGLI